jgi:hypothetical protein
VGVSLRSIFQPLLAILGFRPLVTHQIKVVVPTTFPNPSYFKLHNSSTSNPPSDSPNTRPPLSLWSITTTSTHQLPLFLPIGINTASNTPPLTSPTTIISISLSSSLCNLSVLLNNRLCHLPQHPRLARDQHQQE